MIESICPHDCCTGCAACFSVCPVSCIQMIPDEEGFQKPVIDHEKCIQCKKCIKVCPINSDRRPNLDKMPDVYACWNKDDDVRYKSSSGGVFSALASYVLSNGGVVFGAAYDENMIVRHIGIESTSELPRLRGSKYVQSDIGDSFIQVKSLLANNRTVLFTGTPCQIAGLRSFIGHDDNNLITCDIVCHGVPSPGLFSQFIIFIGQKYSKKILDFSFRDKKEGWQIQTSSFQCYDGSSIIINKMHDSFMCAFRNNSTLRLSCYNCQYKNIDRISDITIADFWGIGKDTPFYHNINKGISLVIINNQKGFNIFNTIFKMLFYEKRNLSEALTNQTSLKKSFPIPNERQSIFLKYKENNYNDIHNMLISKISIKDHIYNAIPKVVLSYTVPILKFILLKNRRNPKYLKTNNKIGIITYHSSNNYGAMLQCYALSKKIESLGFQPYIINYIRRGNVLQRALNIDNIYNFLYNLFICPITFIKHLIISFIGYFKNNTKHSQPSNITINNDSFLQKHMILSKRYYSLISLKLDPPRYSVYITGSDQVWSLSNMLFYKAYFLDFGDNKTKRISYAPSLGAGSIEKKWYRLIKQMLKRIDFISCRETSGTQLLSDASNRPVLKIIDPVFLLENYNSIATFPSSKNYLFVYKMSCDSDISNSFDDYVLKLSEKNKKSIIAVSFSNTNKYPTLNQCSVEEFLGYLINSDYVITNSFHGTALSIIHNKSFIVFPRDSMIGKGQNDRMISLLSDFNLDDRYLDCKDNDYNIETIINWNDVNKKIEQFRQEATNYLLNSLQ